MSEREELITKVAEAIWGELERQHNADGPFTPYVDPEMDIIDGPVDMTSVAEAAFDVLVQAWQPPF